MSHPPVERLPYILDTIIQRVPPTSGVFALFAQGECVLVGATDDICASLLQTYYEDTPGLREKELTHFTFELVTAEGRSAREAECLREFRPLGTLVTEVPAGDLRRRPERIERCAVTATRGVPPP